MSNGEQDRFLKGCCWSQDIDGTLAELTEIPQNNIEAINRFIALGGTFTLCTGRPKCALTEILPQLKVTAPIITINGGYVYSPQDDTVLFGAELRRVCGTLFLRCSSALTRSAPCWWSRTTTG